MKLIRKIKALNCEIAEAFVRSLNKRSLTKAAGLAPAKRKIAFHTPLPPAKTGAGIYALNVYQNIIDDLDVVSDFLRASDYSKALECVPDNCKKHIVPQSLAELHAYEHHVLNLGNSPFHMPYLLYGIKTKGDLNRHIVLCETQICGLVHAYCKRKDVNFYKLLQQIYPDRIQNSSLRKKGDLWENLHKTNIYGIRFLINATGIKHFIVYREIGKELLLADLKGSAYENGVTVDVIPMALKKIDPYPVEIPLDEEALNIASFGMAENIKQTDKVISAVDLLNRQGVKATLWLVGYDVETYVKQLPSPNVRAVENADYQTLMQYMASVDLAVQLRKFSNGEGSGCISELIALNKNFIAADNLFESYIRETGVSISSDCSVEFLAEQILKQVENKTVRNNSKILDKYTVMNTAEKLMEVLK